MGDEGRGADRRPRARQAQRGRRQQLPGRRRQIGDLALVYDWCFDRLGATQKQRWLDYADPGSLERLAPGQGVLGGPGAQSTTLDRNAPPAAIPITGPAGQPTIPRTTIITRSCAPPCCSGSRATARTRRPTRGSTEFHAPRSERSWCRGSTRTSTAAARAKAPATASRCAAVRALRLLEGDHRRAHRRPHGSHPALRCSR